MIPYGHQSIDDADIEAVVQTLKGDWLTQGPAVETFEETIAAAVEARYAVAFANGTAALHGAAHAAGIGPGSVVATPSLTFVASANCVRYCGGDVALVDVDPATLNMEIDKVPSGVDGIVAVHYTGLPVDLRALEGRRPRVVIEDAAHALGATTPDGPVGNCAHSDMCMFSFHPVKAITTGEGGVITTNSPELRDRLRSFRNHGMVRNSKRGGWYYEIEELAFNYRLTDLQAALGTSQLTKLEAFIDRRNNLAARYRDLLKDAPLVLPPAAPAGFRHAHHLFVVRVPDRAHVYEYMRARDIGVQVHYVPVHHHPLYAAAARRADLPNTDDAYASLLSLPLFPALTDAEQDRVVGALEEALG